MKLLTLSDLKHFWANAVQKIPIKISDLQDDVALGTHIADTDIHVTSSDKTTWNTVTSKANDSDVVHKSGDETINGVKSFINYFLGKDLSGQTVDLNDCVDAYSGAIHYYHAVSNYTNISNKPENKPFILESKTVRYVSSIDYIYYQKIYTADYNASPSIYTRYYRSGSASWSNWIKDTDKFVTTDTAQSIIAVKTITDANLEFKSTSAEYGVSAGDNNVIFKDKNNQQTFKIYNRVFSSGLDNNLVSFLITQKVDNTYYTSNGIQLLANTGNKNVSLRPILANNNADGLSVSLGASDRRWQSVYANNYYYGSNNVEFSSKFVTTDTAQTISGQKVFNDINAISSSSEIGVSGGNNSFKILDKNKKTLSRYEAGTFSGGMAYSYLLVNNGSNDFNGVSLYQPSANLAQLRPYSSTLSLQLGASNRYFSDCYTSKINGVEPSSLSLPSGNANDVIDISSYITDLSGYPNNYVAPSNGFISISATGTGLNMFIDGVALGVSLNRATSGSIKHYIPILKNQTVKILVIASSLEYVKFFPCQGNV